ncbi:MAG: ABC transporter permease [Solirubrobacterales bacterium]|nr:ABC transporter permease [Solirubrobacterales bacterium]
MRWLLLKDLQILWRSPAQFLLLVLYPILIALLVGFALTRGPEQSTVALYNAAPPGATLGIEKAKLSGAEIRNQLCERVDCVDATSRQEALDLVRSGTATAAVILPEELASQIRSLASISPQRPKIEIVVNGSDTVENQVVDDRIDSMLAEANLLIAKRLATGAVNYLDLLGSGGELELLGNRVEVLGLSRAATTLREIRAELPPGPGRDKLDRAIEFARLAAANLDLAEPMLRAIAQPIEADKTEVGGSAASLDTFAIAATAALALMFVTVLLVAGSLALEREENAFTRLAAGLTTRSRILVAKLGLGTVVGFGVVLLLLVVMTAFLPIEWSRAPLWILATVLAALAFAAVGAALGAVTREVRAASLGAIMICLPLALLSLVPDDAVGALIQTVIGLVTALFPFRPALDALSGGLELAGPGIWVNLAHLLVLTLAYGAVARLALRRF